VLVVVLVLWPGVVDDWFVIGVVMFSLFSWLVEE